MPKKKITKRFADSVDVKKQTSFYDKQTSGLILRVTKKGTKTWCYRYRVNGKNKRKTLGRYPSLSINEARKQATALNLKKLNGTAPAGKGILFDDLIKEFKQKHLPSCRAKTQKEYKMYIKSEIVPAFGGMKAGEVLKRDIIELLGVCRTKGCVIIKFDFSFNFST